MTKELTLRENMVALLVSKGMTTSEISKKLGIKFYTVESHRKNIRKKLKIRNTAELISKLNGNNIPELDKNDRVLIELTNQRKELLRIRRENRKLKDQIWSLNEIIRKHLKKSK